MQMNLCETEAESRTRRQTGDCQGGGAGGRSGVWDQQTQSIIHKIDKQQGLLYINLLYISQRAGYIQYPVISNNGK